MLNNIRNVHFVGIGGAGMSAIAIVLLEMGYKVSGSDLSKSPITDKLEKMGAKIFADHHADNIEDAEAIVVSTAIPQNNPEVVRAKEKGIIVYHRSHIVAALMNEYKGIAVAGAHGKTTTTSMISLMLEKAGTDPTILIGGELEELGGSAKLGHGEYLVAEADESDASFLKLSPYIAVVTNIENDHMDFYKTMENILQTFKKFLHKLPSEAGFAVLSFDNDYVKDIALSMERKYISYAIQTEADYMAKNIRFEGSKTIYDVYDRQGVIGTITINVPGKHNVSNSLAAVVVGLKIGLTFEEIANGLEMFSGAKRRFQTKGMVNDVWIVDDYAHHPTEIMTTLVAARQTNPKRLICVFQPHRYTRTNLLRKEFGRAFSPADVLILTDVYSAGEQPIHGVNGETLQKEVKDQTGQDAIYIQDRKDIAPHLAKVVRPGDLVITMGAGNIYSSGEELVSLLTK